MARLTNNTLRTVRFYEEAGILHPDRRSAGGHRLFSVRQLDRLRFITDMRTAGLSLEEIRQLLSLKVKARNGPEAARAVRAAIERQIASLEAKLGVFTRLRSDLQLTQELLEDCEQCDNQESFPESCRECPIVSSEQGGTLSLRVLWALAPVREPDAP